jgi:cytochrome d ubiquinol oxidase subunit I
MAVTFYFFRIMFLTAILMFIVAMTSVALRFTGKLYSKTWFLKLCLWMLPAGVIATVAGWVTSEAGRQPYVIYGLLRTSAGDSPLSSGQVVFSFSLFLIVYLTLLFAYIRFVRKIVITGPDKLTNTLRIDNRK